MQTCTDVAVLWDGLTCPGGPAWAGCAASSARSGGERASLIAVFGGLSGVNTHRYFGGSFHKAAFTGSPPGAVENGLCIWGACVPLPSLWLCPLLDLLQTVLPAGIN